MTRKTSGSKHRPEKINSRLFSLCCDAAMERRGLKATSMRDFIRGSYNEVAHK